MQRGQSTRIEDRPISAASFDPGLTARLDRLDEVDIETARASGEPRRTTIWIVTDGSHVYVRSVRGEAGRWYQDLLANPEGAILVGSERAAVRARPAVDPGSIELVSALLRAKYARHRASTEAMLQPETLGTTLRLDPR